MIFLPKLKTALSYLNSSRQNTGMWRTGIRTDRQTESLWLLQRHGFSGSRYATASVDQSCDSEQCV